jgi:hypothetical protein
MRLTDIMNESDLMEFGEIGTDPSTMVAAPGAVPGATATPMPATSNDPKVQGAMQAQQMKMKQEKRKAIQDQITSLTKQISDLRRQMSSIK